MDGLKKAGEVVEDYIAGCEGKIRSSFSKLFVKAVLAGAMIALGACAGNVASHALSNVGLARFVSALVFPVGLMMIVLIGAELFTGDCLMAMSWMAKKRVPFKHCQGSSYCLWGKLYRCKPYCFRRLFKRSV